MATHFTLPWYVGSSALSARRLSPSTIRLSCRLAFRLRPFERTGVSAWNGAPRWKFSTKTRPLNWSDGMAGCVQRRVSARRTPRRRRPPIRIPLAPRRRRADRRRTDRRRAPSCRVAQPAAPGGGRIGIRGRARRAPAALIPRRATHAAPGRGRISAGRIGVRGAFGRRPGRPGPPAGERPGRIGVGGRVRKAPAALVPRRATRTRPRDAWRFPGFIWNCPPPGMRRAAGGWPGWCVRRPLRA